MLTRGPFGNIIRTPYISAAVDDGAAGGGAPASDPPDTGTQPADAAAGDAASSAAPDDGLGDAGKRAIDAMKRERNEARAQAHEFQAQLDAIKAQQAGTEAEHAAQIEAQRIRDEALAAANTRILKAEIRAAAAGKLTDPADALHYLDLSQFEVGDDGAVGTAEIATAIDDLVKSKPYLAAQGSRFTGIADGGTRNEVKPVTQITDKSLLNNMTPAQLVEATKNGSLDQLLGHKTS